MEERYLSTGKAARLAKVSFMTIKRMIYAGKLKAEKNPVGRWLILESEVNRLLGNGPAQRKRAILYARVSSHEQKEHLKSQVERLSAHAASKGYGIVKVYEEISSGLNENRRKLESAYNKLRKKKADVVLVEFKDRLSRFGFNYLSKLAESYGASVEVVNGDVKKDAMQELVEDMISIVTIFSAKLYGMRSQKFRQVMGVVKSAVHD